ncbi:MAG: hypothetical protein SFZ03_00195 [Candidatus Melainabacteria bacterium]|nr:hypothetical protein [Candidatus Melainabacteria bacterium]
MSEQTTALVVSGIGHSDILNPFQASPEELLAGVLDENGLLNEATVINQQPAQPLAQAYYRKRQQFRQATRLGQLLLQSGLIHAEQLTEALLHQQQLPNPRPLGELVVDLGYCQAQQVEALLSQQQRIRQDYDALEESRETTRNLWQQLRQSWFSPKK